MCGIVGLFALDDSIRSRMGEWFTPMLRAMTERGPDSAGIAVYRRTAPEEHLKYSMYEPSGDFDWSTVRRQAAQTWTSSATVDANGRYAILACRGPAARVRDWLAETAPSVRVMGTGAQMEIYKDIGAPGSVAERYGIQDMAADCMIGHTRMATESAVNVAGSHPYTAGEDLCLVHNGSLANHHSLRRIMERDSMRFDSWNDTEVAARFLQWRLGKGEPLKESLLGMIDTFSGFFTLAVGFKDHFAVLRDPYACKPLVIAESAAYVACASEFRALAHLPGISDADLYEPQPEKVYIWSRS